MNHRTQRVQLRQVPGTAADLQYPLTRPHVCLVDQDSVGRRDTQQSLKEIVKRPEPLVPHDRDVAPPVHFSLRAQACPSRCVLGTMFGCLTIIERCFGDEQGRYLGFAGRFLVYHGQKTHGGANDRRRVVVGTKG